MSMVQQAIEVSAPLHTVYEQLAAFENYPRFMTGVQRVTPVGNRQTHWVMDVDGKHREFDAQITELSFDERVSWSTMEGPRLSETITVRPMGDTRTQVVAQLEADIAFLMPSDRHGQETLNRRLKDDLSTFKSLVESGKLTAPVHRGASTKQMAGRSSTIFGSGPHIDPASPASVAARIRSKPHPGAGWGTSADTVPDDTANMGPNVDITSAPGIAGAADLDDVLAPGRRIATGRPVHGGAAGTTSTGRSGSAPMGGRTSKNDGWGEGMINEEDRGSAHDY
jgi:carbon monoxide dehydrogenase subunit G